MCVCVCVCVITILSLGQTNRLGNFRFDGLKFCACLYSVLVGIEGSLRISNSVHMNIEIIMSLRRPSIAEGR